MDKIRSEDAVALNIDLMFAIVLLLAGVAAALLGMPSLTQEEKDWRIAQYMAATRATDTLVQDPGDPGWEANWKLGVSKIGFLYVDGEGRAMQKVLNLTKIEALMGDGYKDKITGMSWWEYPNQSTSQEEKDSAARALGLGEGLGNYNFYMQLHPVNPSAFDPAPLHANLSKQPVNLETATTTDRYVYIADPSSTETIKYLEYNNLAIHYRLNLWVW